MNNKWDENRNKLKINFQLWAYSKFDSCFFFSVRAEILFRTFLFKKKKSKYIVQENQKGFLLLPLAAVEQWLQLELALVELLALDQPTIINIQ